MSEMIHKQCQWRDCGQEGHGHRNVTFMTFGKPLDFGGIYLCEEHCKQARRTGHMDILISGITMGPCPPTVLR